MSNNNKISNNHQTTTDLAGIQFKILNRSKGPAVYGPRAQIDRKIYKRHMQEYLHSYPNLTIRAGSVADLIITNGNNEQEYREIAAKGAQSAVEGIRLGKCVSLLATTLCLLLRAINDVKTNICYQRMEKSSERQTLLLRPGLSWAGKSILVMRNRKRKRRKEIFTVKG